MITTSDIRKGLCIRYSNDIYKIIEFLHVKPGKGPAFVRTKLKSVSTGKVVDNTFSAGHKIDDVRVENREALMAWLKNNNIGSRIMYPPINKQEAYNIEGEYEVSNQIGESGLWLPSSSKLTNEQIDYICKKIQEFYLK